MPRSRDFDFHADDRQKQYYFIPCTCACGVKMRSYTVGIRYKLHVHPFK